MFLSLRLHELGGLEFFFSNIYIISKFLLEVIEDLNELPGHLTLGVAAEVELPELFRLLPVLVSITQ